VRAWDTRGQRWQPSPAPDTARLDAVDRGLRVVAVSVAVVVLGTVTFGGGRLVFRDNGAQASEAAGEATPGVTDTAGTSAGTEGTEEPGGDQEGGAGSESPTAEEPPPGFVAQDDVEGFAVQVREDWQRRAEQREAGVVVYYESGDGEGYLQVYRISEPGFTPYDALEETDRQVGLGDGYERLRLEDLDAFEGSQTAELEYRVPRENGTVGQSLLRAFVAEDGERWVVLVAGPTDAWDPTYAESAAVAAASFCPQGYCPATP
jgi:hypothetical protein